MWLYLMSSLLSNDQKDMDMLKYDRLVEYFSWLLFQYSFGLMKILNTFLTIVMWFYFVSFFCVCGFLAALVHSVPGKSLFSLFILHGFLCNIFLCHIMYHCHIMYPCHTSMSCSMSVSLSDILSMLGSLFYPFLINVA